MPDLNQLNFFAQVARAQSFTLASKSLGVPKSTVSRAVASLEARLGVRLVERTTRSVSLTEAGHLYYDHCQRVLEEAEQADLAMGALQAAPRGRLRVSAPVTFARSLLVPVLGDFLHLYPQINLQLHFLGRDADVIIQPGPLEDSGLLVTPLLRIHLGIYASPEYLEGREVPRHPADLKQHRCVATNCGVSGEPADSASWLLRNHGDLQKIRVDARVSVPDPIINFQLALAGVGVAMLSHKLAAAEVEKGRLVPLLPEWEPDPVEFYALYPPRLSSSPKVHVFVQFLRQKFGKNK